MLSAGQVEKTAETGLGFTESIRLRRISENRSENPSLLITISIYVKKCKKIPLIITKNRKICEISQWSFWEDLWKIWILLQKWKLTGGWIWDMIIFSDIL